ncbi:phage tail tape measure protein [Microbacterium maritypicum]|uniref:Phage tail tape measure protein domain-containing protein n=1 Tax=Microbacterium maritypicum MF109 TaxID=1333857 RepID=T5KWP1_MICMQ|nr:phage tail tape measure protein [Microbacterium liquefaciens]EQM83426.1 hypothetical protein L687_12465 [Microbacterium maritypicum MF109]
MGSAEGVELATVWLRMVPTMEGATENVTKALLPGENAAGESGKRAGSEWAAKAKGAIGVAAVGAAIVGTFKGLYEVGSIFDDVTDTIRVGTGAQGEALDGLVQVAKNVGANVPASFDKIGSTVADLNTRLGLSGETLTTVSAQYLEAGRILGEDVDINATSAAFNAFKIEGEGVSSAMDTLFQVSQATGVGINQLASGAQSAAPALQNLGFSFEDSVSLLGSLDKAGLNSQQVMASLSKGLVTLAKDGEEPQAAFQRVTGEMQSFVDKGETAAALDLASQIFGTRGAAQFVGALQSGVVNLDDLQASVGATGDTILGVADETADFSEQWMVFKNRALTALEPVGTAIFNGLGSAMKFVNGLFDDVPDLGAVFGPIIATFGEVASVIWEALAPAFAQIWQAISPLLPVLLDLWMSVSPVMLIFKALEPVLPMLASLFGQLASVIGQALGAALPPIVSLMTTLGGILGTLFEALIPVVTTLVSALFPIIEALIPVVVALLAAFAPLIGALVEALAPILTSVAEIVGMILVPVFNLIATVITALAGVITWLVNTIIVPLFNGFVIPVVKEVGRIFTDVFSGLGSFFEGIWAGIRNTFKGFINFIIDGINGFIGGLNEVGNFVSDVTGGTIDFSIGKIPRLADGATILPRSGGTLAVLAEAGRPESVVDTGLMNQALEEGISGNQPAGVTQHITLKTNDPRLAIRQLGREAQRGLAAS